MQRTKYAVEFKDAALKQVIDKGVEIPWSVRNVCIMPTIINSC
jgi:hypothetical protein